MLSINSLFIGFLIRSGLQIAGAHPRLYWNDDCDPKSSWIKFTRKKVPGNKLYTSMDDEMPVSSVIALPGGDNLDLGRLWHFFSIVFWELNGEVYVVLRQNLSPRGTSGRGVPSITKHFD